MMILFSMWLVLLCSLLNMNHHVCASPATVMYLTVYSNSAFTPSFGQLANRRNLTITESSDDSPYDRVDLPFPFPFFGEDYDRTFTDPNGVLHFSAILDCQNFCNDMNRNYRGAIAGVGADFDPTQSFESTISFAIDPQAGYPDFVEFEYSKLRYYNTSASSAETTFHIRLFRSGKIYIDYDSFDPIYAEEGYGYEWMSAIRPFDKWTPATASKLPFHLTTEQINIGKDVWDIVFPAIYPPSMNVSDGRAFNACPVSREWCATDSSFYLTNETCSGSLDGRNYTILLSGLTMTCADEIDFAISFNDDLSSIGNCSVSNDIPHLNCSLLIPIKTLCSQNLSTTEVYGLTILWKPAAAKYDGISLQSMDYMKLDINPIPITITHVQDMSGLVLLDACSINQDQSSIFNPDSFYGPPNTTFASVGNCSICNGNLTSLQLPCSNSSYIDSAWTGNAVPDLYRYESCDGGCYDYFETDKTGDCCAIDDLDCSGVCDGHAEVVLSGFSYQYDNGVQYNSYICCARNQIDCLNICHGDAAFDVCGICQGNETNIFSCNDVIAVTVNDGLSRNDSVLLSFDVSDLANNPVSTVSTKIDLFNPNGNASNVMFSVSDNTAGPNISVPLGVLTILPNQTETYYIISSTTFNEPLAARTVLINFAVPGDGDITNEMQNFGQAIEFYPSSVGCNVFETFESCSAISTCMYCGQLDIMHVITEGSDRALLNRVTPDIMGGKYTNPGTPFDEGGVCVDGWQAKDCDSFRATLMNEPANNLSVGLDTDGLLVLLIIMGDIFFFILCSVIFLFPTWRRKLFSFCRTHFIGGGG